MRVHRDPDYDLKAVALFAATGLVVVAVAVLTLDAVASEQLAALEQCQAECQMGGPALPAPWADPWFYVTGAVPLAIVGLGYWLAPMAADLRSYGE